MTDEDHIKAVMPDAFKALNQALNPEDLNGDGSIGFVVFVFGDQFDASFTNVEPEATADMTDRVLHLVAEWDGDEGEALQSLARQVN